MTMAQYLDHRCLFIIATPETFTAVFSRLKTQTTLWFKIEIDVRTVLTRETVLSNVDLFLFYFFRQCPQPW